MTKNSVFSSIQTRFKTSSKNEDGLDAICHFFNSYKRKYFVNSLQENPQSEKDFRNSLLMDNGKTLYDRRYGRSMQEDVEGIKESIQSNRKNHILNKKEKIKSYEKTLKKKSTKYKNAKKNNLGSKEAREKSRYYLSLSYGKLKNMKSYLSNLEDDFNEKKFSICFGSKKLFKQQFKGHVTHQYWQKKWQLARNDYFRLTGAKHETCGNSNAQLSLTKHGIFQFKVRVPRALEQIHGKYIVIEDVKFKHEAALIQQYVLNNQHKDPSLRQALSFMIKKDKRGYRLIVQLSRPTVETVTNQHFGVIGIDINPDNVAMSEMDEKGRLLNSKVYPFNLTDKSSGERITLINLAINQIVDYSVDIGKDIVIETLEFTKKKNQLVAKENPNYARMLSSFSYGKMMEQFRVRCFKKGVVLHDVNPAYTSLIGKLNYTKKYGVSDHQAAALVIGRKYLGLKECFEPNLTILHKGKAFMLTIPARILKAQGEESYKFLRALYKWFNGEKKATSQWIQIIDDIPLINPSG